MLCDKERDSRPKLSPTLKFHVADKLQYPQPKLSPAPKFPLADKAWGQPKLSPTPKFCLADNAFVKQFGTMWKILKQTLAQLSNFLWLTKRGINQNLVQLQNFL